MDDETTILISNLLDKLAEFDQKVCHYRQEMAQEFQLYSRRLLHNVPEHVSARVGEVLADELHNYSALSPGFALDTTSADLGRSAVGRWARCGRVSPPPVLPHTSGVPPLDATTPDRSRDREFHGLFTPNFLPLLEVVQPKPSVPTPTAALSPIAGRAADSDHTRESPDRLQLNTSSPGSDLARPRMEDTPSPVISDDSGSVTRKSALRRSSTGSAKELLSPRRVRFDVEGEEVLPTASPPILPQDDDVATSLPTKYRAPLFHDSLNQVVFEEEDSVLGSSPPRPKKISSTERLKALARSSTEDTSKWTVVGDVYDDDDEEEGLVMSSLKKRSKSSTTQPALNSAPTTATGSYPIQESRLEDIIKDARNGNYVDQLADNREDLASITSAKSLRMCPPPTGARLEERSGMQQVFSGESKQSMSSTISPSQLAGGRKEEDMFIFDDDDDDDNDKSPVRLQLQSNTSKYVEEEEDEDELEAEQDAISHTENAAEAAPVTLLSTSPAVPIAKPASLPATSSALSGGGRTAASMGSYKGVSFTIGVLRNEELHQKAMEMGDFQSFVGSVDGRSGMDPSDFNGTPRSLGERLMEEAYERRMAERLRKKKSNVADST